MRGTLPSLASRLAITLALLGLISAAACAPASTPRPAATPALDMPAGPQGAAGPAGPRQPSEAVRMIVRTGSMTLLVNSMPEATDQITTLAGRLGGYVVSSTRQGEEAESRATVSIRVPAESFDEAIRALRSLAVRVISEGTQSQDVTEEYVDLQSRLRNLEATESQYLVLLGRAQTVEDTLKVQQALSNVRGDIEQTKGRMQYLERTSAMSLITVELRSATSPKPLVQQGWSPLETAKSAVRGLTSIGQVLADMGIWLLILSPLWAPVVAIVLVVTYLQRRKARRRTPPPQAGGPEEPQPTVPQSQ